MSLSTPKLLLPNEYLKKLTQDIKKARQRVYILTMIMTDDDVTREFVDALCIAANRGVSVNVAADIFTYAEIGGHFKFHSHRNTKVKAATDLKRRLTKNGVNFRWLGKSSSSILNGRTHCKWAVVDDTVYSFGGVNLYASGLNGNDYMLRQQDNTLGDRLVNAQVKITRADRNNTVHRSQKFPTDYGVVMLDGGLLGDSIIYRRACHLATKAKNVTYVSQYCPTGRLGRLLKKTNAKLYFNHWNKASSLNALTIRLGSWLSGHQTIYKRSDYLHAKLMIFEFADGKKTALSGSHNFSHGGVWLGTREIALETHDKKIISQFENFIENHVD